ncbi:MAG: dUTP diphosphatase [Armatimonadetes bacterium]|jgi:dUTP pyrophosphatase|nr:dUTP diphosphatase [Armatimonadota bacterium]MDI9601495.1 dUTP diphosphatase [Acidobacteriota bacterium]
MTGCPVRVRVRRLAHAEGLDLPAYATDGAAGMDVRAAVSGSLVIEPGAVALVPTGLEVEVPVGYEVQVRPRSGLALRHRVTVLNSPGTIDSDYRGEVQVIMVNLGPEPFEIGRGDRIAQLVLAPVARAEWDYADSLEQSIRGEGGFGHTGLD